MASPDGTRDSEHGGVAIRIPGRLVLRTSCASRPAGEGGDYASGMSSVTPAEVPTWVKVTVWSIAIGLAVLGVVLAVVSSSFLPLIMFAGLAVPMMPIGSLRPSRRVASGGR